MRVETLARRAQRGGKDHAEARGRGDFLKEVHAEAQRGRILVRARRMILRLENNIRDWEPEIRAKKSGPEFIISVLLSRVRRTRIEAPVSTMPFDTPPDRGYSGRTEGGSPGVGTRLSFPDFPCAPHYSLHPNPSASPYALRLCVNKNLFLRSLRASARIHFPINAPKPLHVDTSPYVHPALQCRRHLL